MVGSFDRSAAVSRAARDQPQRVRSSRWLKFPDPLGNAKLLRLVCDTAALLSKQDAAVAF